MKFIDGLNWVVILGIIVAIETQIGNGTMSLANMVPETWIPFVKAWAANLGTIGALIMSAGAFGRTPSGQTPAIPQAIKSLILLGVLILSLLFIRPGYAGDLPAKSPAAVSNPCLPTSCSGFYAGMNLAGTMTNANVIGNGINGSVAAGGQSIGGQVGYQFANGTWFFGPELDANYIVGGNVNVTGGAPEKFRTGEYLKVGTALASLFGLQAPSVGTPGIPAALANSVISPYVLFGAVQSGFGQGWATGAGVEFAIAQNWFVDTRYTYINYGGGATVSPTETAKSENLVTVGFNYKF